MTEPTLDSCPRHDGGNCDGIIDCPGCGAANWCDEERCSFCEMRLSDGEDPPPWIPTIPED